MASHTYWMLVQCQVSVGSLDMASDIYFDSVELLLHCEGTYGSGIVFKQGQTVSVPDDLALKLLKHPDVYAKGSTFTPLLHC